jgi:hypothetical protein
MADEQVNDSAEATEDVTAETYAAGEAMQAFFTGAVVGGSAIAAIYCLFAGHLFMAACLFIVVMSHLRHYADQMRTILFGVIAGLLFVPSQANAGNCHQFFYPQQVVAVAPVFAAPVYYQAGRDIEAEALAEKVARLVAPKVAEHLKLASSQVRAAVAAETSGGGSASTQSALAQHCAKCHSGAAPKANAVFDGSTPIRCEQAIAALKSIRDGSMPKDHQVPADIKGQLMEELLALSGKGSAGQER